MYPLQRVDWQPENWQCSVCLEDHVSRDRPPGLPWATREDDLVCEACVKAPFENALKHDISWPAKWGVEILDIEHFRSILPADLIAKYNGKEAKFLARRTMARDDLQSTMVQGMDYQLCPWCRIVVYLEDGCDHISCPCGASFCFICGNAAFDREDGFNHWALGGCPKYHAPNSGREQYDNGTYDPSEPHLLPLGRVHGALRYVNGDDEHNDEPYRNADALSWNDCNHQHNLYDQFGHLFLSYRERHAMACGDFNHAMQSTSKAAHLGVTLRRILDPHLGPVTSTQHQAILDAMSKSFRPGEAAPPHFDCRWWHGELLEEVLALRKREARNANRPHYPFVFSGHSADIGLLYAPIGGIFNLRNEESRPSALQWVTRTLLEFKSEDDPANLALFNISPGHRSASMLRIFNAFRKCQLVLPRYRITFTRITNGAILVRVWKRSDPLPGYPDNRIDIGIVEKLRSALMICEDMDFQRLDLQPLAD